MGKKCLCSCGMSLQLTAERKIERFMVPGVVFRRARFAGLVVLLVALSCGMVVLRGSSYSPYVKDAVGFLFSWCIMMATMTSNVFVLFAVLSGLLAGRYVLGHLNMPVALENSCCA